MKTVFVDASNGTRFRLNSREMVECSPIPYIALRQEIKSAFNGATHIPYFVRGRLIQPLAYVKLGSTATLGQVNNQIDIGCMTFSGVEFRKLKKWAKERPKVKHARTRR